MSLIQADARYLPLKDGCVQCVVTSPPYFGLRNYGHAGQIGLESSPDAYVTALVAVFRDVRRTLKDDGVCWLNLGDSYNSGTQFNHHSGGLSGGARYSEGARGDWPGHRPMIDRLKPKDLLGIPWRVAFALRADGWYLRSDIIWSKPNPMPESVTDRPTKAHEYLFLLTKSAKYYYDADAIAEVSAYAGEQAGVCRGTKRRAHAMGREPSGNEKPGANWIQPETRNKRSVWEIATMPYAGAHFAPMPEKLVEPCILAGSRLGDLVLDPFMGSGTVCAVAERLGRRWVGTDLNPAYHALAKKRTSQRGLRFQETA